MGRIVIDYIGTKIVGFRLLSNDDIEKYINTYDIPMRGDCFEEWPTEMEQE